jgi:uncharacterized protein (UPF0276 family)
MKQPHPPYPFLGYGLGLRVEHYDYILEHKPAVDWFEIISENFMIPGGRPLYYLDKVREDYPMVIHGVSLSIGSSDPLDMDYLKKLKTLADRIEPKWISDHLCWTGLDKTNLHDLMPLPYTEEAIKHIVDRIKRVQDYLGRRILIENVSSYVTYKQSQMTEWDFLTEVVEQADALILMDVNNVFVSAFNHSFDPMDYLNAIPIERVQQIHLAGHENCGTHIIDTHDHPIIEGVWALYEAAIKRFGRVSTMIERDGNMPEFPELFAELQQAKAIAEAITEGVSA